MKMKNIRISFFFCFTFALMALLVACNSGLITPLKTTGVSPVNSSSPSDSVATDSPSITIASSPTFAPTPTHFIGHLPTLSLTPSPMAPLSDDSDLLTATPKTFYKDIPYIQIIQDNKVVEPVNGVINLTYTPFVFRYVSTFRAPLYVNFSFNNTFQNSAHEGLDPFLPCPNPYCEDNQLNMEQHHIITIDDNKYNFMLFCRDDKYVSYDEFWAWDRCNIFGTAEWHTSHLHEHDLREFGLLVDNNIVVHPISELKSFGDKIYITAYCVAINRALKEAIPYQDQIFQLIKIILQFEE